MKDERVGSRCQIFLVCSCELTSSLTAVVSRIGRARTREAKPHRDVGVNTRQRKTTRRRDTGLVFIRVSCLPLFVFLRLQLYGKRWVCLPSARLSSKTISDLLLTPSVFPPPFFFRSARDYLPTLNGPSSLICSVGAAHARSPVQKPRRGRRSNSRRTPVYFHPSAFAYDT